MVHPAMARGGGGRCGETCAGLFTGIAGIAVLFALATSIDGAWHYDKLKAKAPTMMARRNYIVLAAFLLIAIIAFGYFSPGFFFAAVILTVLVGCALVGISWLALRQR
jgi:small-conductance mechanosensitive channel